MALKHNKPNHALMQELELVARAATELAHALKTANALPKNFPVKDIQEVLKTLQGLPNGSAEGCRVPLDLSRLRLAEIGQQHIKIDNGKTSIDETDDETPSPTRGTTIDQGIGNVVLQISYAQAEYQRQAGEGDADDGVERIVRPDAAMAKDLAALGNDAKAVECECGDLGDHIRKTTISDSERADELHRQALDAEGHARLAKNELQRTEIRPLRLEKITIVLRRLPAIIEKTGKALQVGIDVARPFADQWIRKLPNDIYNLAIAHLYLFSENLEIAGRRLKPSSPHGSVRRMHGEIFRDIDESWCPEMVVIHEGSFLMGSPAGEGERSDNEGPQHRVIISQAFALGRYTITFEQYDYFCGKTERKKPHDQNWGRGRRPVINVRHSDALAYCVWLSETVGAHYRLPTEAEWEFACRAGTVTAYSFGDRITIDDANFGHSIDVGRTNEIGGYPSNNWALHDMHGNVWEWCADGFREYAVDTVKDPRGPKYGSGRVLRGGCWGGDAHGVRSARRDVEGPDLQYDAIGFRCARTLE